MHSFTCCHMVVAFDCRLFIVVLIILYLASMHYCLVNTELPRHESTVETRAPCRRSKRLAMLFTFTTLIPDDATR